MSFFAKLTKVDLEALGADPTPIQGRFYLNTTTGMKWYDGGFWRAAVDTDSIQNVSNKVLIATTVSDFIDFVEVAPPANPVAGQQRIYAKADGKIYKRNNAGTEIEIGSGAGSDSSFKLDSIAASVLTLKGGYLQLDDGRELATYSVPNYAVDISVALLTLFGAPVLNTTYYLYIDLDTLGAEQTQATTGRKLYQINQAQLVLTETKPSAINRARYVALGSVVGGSGAIYKSTDFTTIAARKHDNGPLAINPKVYSLSQAVGSVGSASQIKAGHILDSASFPSTILTTARRWYGLASVTDGSENGDNLTANGGMGFTGAGILGGTNSAALLDGTDDNLSSTAAGLNPANSQPFAVGGWFAATNWQSAQKSMISQANPGDLSFEIAHDATTIIFRATNTAGSFDARMNIPQSAALGFTAASWHHFVMLYDFSTLTLKAYIDGKLVGTSALANLRGATSANFRIGSLNSGDFFAGRADEVFVVKNHLLTDSDIQKLYSTKIDHNANVASANQDWKVILGSSSCKLPNWQPIVCQNNANTLYADFSDLTSTETVDLALLDLGMSPVVVPAVAPFDQTYNSNPSFPIAHGLSEVPNLQVGYKDASNDWHWTTGEGAVKADSTQLKGSLQTYFDAGATQVRIRAVVGASPTGVKEASASQSGIVSTGTQTIAGAKTFSGRVATGNSKVSAYISSATISINTASETVIPFNVEDFDTNSEFDTTTNVGRFTPTKAGYYLVTVNSQMAAASALKHYHLRINKNGSGVGRVINTVVNDGTVEPNLIATGIFYLNGTTDYIHATIEHNNAVARNLYGTNTGSRISITELV